MRTRILLIGLILFAAVVRVSAQDSTSEIFIDKYAIPGVIRSTYVAAMTQDEYGLLWVGTSSGLFRYDGNRFVHYPYSETDFSLDARQINAVLWDSLRHRLLIGTRMGGLLQLKSHDTHITPLTRSEISIHAMTQTTDGRIWVLGSQGLQELIGDSLTLIATSKSLRSPSALASRGNEVFVGAVLQVCVFRDGRGDHKINFDGNRNFTSTTRVTAIMADDNNQLWVGFEREGVLIYNRTTRSKVREFLPDRRPFYSRINSIHRDREGWVWILTKAEGLAVVDPERGTFQHIRQDLRQRSSISGNNCYAILEDQTGVVWIGTNGDLNVFNREQRKFKHYANDPSDENSLSDNMVRSVHQPDDRTLWVGTDGGYINIINLETDRIKRVKVGGVNLPKNEVVTPFCFAELPGGLMLVGTNFGLLQWNRANNAFDYYKPLLPHLGTKRVRQLVYRNGLLYGLLLGVFFDFEVSTGTFSSHLLPQRNNVTVLRFDSHDSLWLGSNAAVSTYNRKKGSFTYQSLPQDTANFMVLSLDEVRDKMMVSTMNHGIFEASIGDTGIVIGNNITHQNGLPDNTVYGVMPDDFGNLWIPTNRGLSRIDPAGRFIQYETSEGVQADEFNRLTHLKLNDGRLVAGGINGINIIDPVRAIGKTANSRPLILSVHTRSQRDSVVERAVLQNTNLVLPDNVTGFTVYFTIPDYRRPLRYQLQYKMEGYDSHWHDANGNNMANYSQLDPGGYEFKLRGLNPAGEVLETTLSIYLKPPFWVTWWFRLMLSMVVIGVAIASFRLRVHRERRDKARLEALLQLRTREIEQSRAQLANMNEKKDLIFSILSHDLRAPLTTLKGFLGLLVEDGDNFTREEIKKHAELIRTSVANSLDLIDNTLFWSLSQMDSIHSNPVKVSINDLLHKISNLYQLALARKNIVLELSVQPDIDALADENMMYVILRNLVSNAIKFTPENKTITISAFSENNRVVVIVKDQGVGMSATYVNTLFTHDNPVLKKGTANEKGTGLGLALCQRFVSMNNGTLSVASHEGSGSEFRVELPAFHS